MANERTTRTVSISDEVAAAETLLIRLREAQEAEDLAAQAVLDREACAS